MGLFNKEKRNRKAQLSASTEKLMTSQLAAIYLKENDEVYRDIYIKRLKDIGFHKGNAIKMFAFECDVIRKHNKQYLLHPEFTKMWFFGLKQPFFQQYPKTKEDILKECFFTASELCKLTDEAEWHFWNSHEKDLTEDVWNEICEWRLKSSGMEFVIRYFDMIEKKTGIPGKNISELIREQGKHLCRYKW